MSLRVGYVVFYIAFISVLLFFSASMSVDILTGVEQEQLVVPQPPTTGTLLDSLTFLFNMAVFGIEAFGFLVLVNTTYQILFFFVILPLTAGFLWAIIELARGSG